MKKNLWLTLFIIIFLLVILSISCNKDKTKAPYATTNQVTNITGTKAKSGGNVIDDVGSAIIARGVCWSTQNNPTINNSNTSDGDGTGNFTSYITGLKGATIYYFRAYAKNTEGIGYGAELSFTTGPTISDIEGSLYDIKNIGNQVWMADNLKTTKYSDGSAITNVTDNTQWMNLTTPAYCWINNDAATYKAVYGGLYNWYSISATTNGGKNLCPAGWHIPNDAEWETLINYLGGYIVAGGKLKEEGTVHWKSPNTGADNISGFTAIPAGIGNGFSNIGVANYLWSSTVYSATSARVRKLSYNISNIEDMSIDRKIGLSVRCVKD